MPLLTKPPCKVSSFIAFFPNVFCPNAPAMSPPNFLLIQEYTKIFFNSDID